MTNKFTNYFATKPALVSLVALSLLIDSIIYGIITPAIPTILQDEMKASTRVNGLLLGFYGLGVLIGAPSISYLSDKSGKRKLYMILGFLLLGVSSLGIGLSKKVYQIFLARLATGIASGITWSLGLACLIDIYPPHKLDSPISMAYSGFTLGMMGGPFIGGIMYHHFGKMGISYLMFGISMLNMVFRVLVPDSQQLRLTLKESGKLDPYKPIETQSVDLEYTENNIELDLSNPNTTQNYEDKRECVEEKGGVEENGDVVLESPKISFFDLLKEPRIMAACVVTIIVCGGVSGLEVILPIYFSDKFGLNAEKIGYTFISLSMSSVIGGLIFGRVTEMEMMTKRFGPNKKRYFVILAGNFLTGVFTMVLGLTKSVASSVVVMGFIGFCFGFGNVPVMAALGSHISLMSEKRVAEGMTSSGGGANSQVYSLYNIAYSIAFLLVPIISSIIYKSSGFLAVNMILGSTMVVGTVLSIGSVVLFSKGS
ncbi:hypothetical protein BB558_000493 [Smittium angustum]|uniref:Major facilitator superfamily (MFS) profile domain-containing protein n=1 Tax=Smittium angustum TaxID=133377 RepID=A0A2U1IUK0_SMIAN|nr:hypothetical protein BB558_007664 [Smittium angustum]PWA03316.1 hypothetical protein BB558_000493 [Smittium angustum]